MCLGLHSYMLWTTSWTGLHSKSRPHHFAYSHDELLLRQMMLTALSSKLLLVNVLLIGIFTHPAVPSHGGEGSRAPLHAATHKHGHKRSLQQLGRPWIDNGGTWPAGFSELDKAVETQRIFRAVLAERNRTTYASRYPDIAWRNWLVRYNVTYNATEASYRRSIFDYNLALAKQLNELAGPEVAFGINRFSVLTEQEFLAGYTGDAQNDGGVTVSGDDPQAVASPAAAVIAAMRAAAAEAAAAAANASLALNGSTALNGSAGEGADAGEDAATGGDSGLPDGGVAGTQQPLPGAGADINGGSGRRLQQEQLQTQQADGWEEEQQELQQLQQPSAEPQTAKGWWQWLMELMGLTSSQQQQEQQRQQQRQREVLWTQFPHPEPQQLLQQQRHLQQGGTATRRLRQQVPTSGPFTPQPFCSKQVAFPYSGLLPFQAVDWLRVGVVRGLKEQPSNCSNSFAFVAAALAESTMAMQGYNGSAQDISEQQLMECFPGSSCSRGGTVHVLLNYLACNGVAAVGSSYSESFGNYPAGQNQAADYSGKCAVGAYQPVVTGITGWAWVPNNEFALGQALSRTPAKVSVDASILQTYRAGYLGCNVASQIANHAMLVVGYNNQVRAGPPPAGSAQNFTFFNGTEYWMLRNSWGSYGSVDGYVYVTRGCPRATPLGMLVNRPLIPTWNQTESYKIGRLECKNETQVNDGCSKELLLKLAGYCAGADDFNPTPQNSSCACSCIPT